jgi:hypothetical protein
MLHMICMSRAASGRAETLAFPDLRRAPADFPHALRQRTIAMIRRAHLLLGLALVATVPGAGFAQENVDPANTATATLHGDQPGPVMNRQVFGQFAEHLGHGIYGGIWVGERSSIPNDHGYRRDVLEALRAIKVPVVRWPGGCFADEYHWRDGVGPRGKRPVKINTNWGGVNEDNAFGTIEYMGFVERLGAEAYVSANVGSAPPSETAQWVEYMTSPNGSTLAKERAADGHAAPFKVPYIGIGNELWGCGGNMRAEYAADLTNRYALFAKSGTGKMLKIASGPSDANYEWTDTLMRLSGKNIDGLSLHYYTRPRDQEWKDKGMGQHDGALAADGRVRHQAFGDHGQIRSGQEGVAGGRRMGHLVRSRSRQQPGLPRAAEQCARRGRRGAQPQHLRASCRPREDGGDRADGERAAGDAAHRRREDGQDADLLGIRSVQALAGCDRVADRREVALVSQGCDGTSRDQCVGGA